MHVHISQRTMYTPEVQTSTVYQTLESVTVAMKVTCTFHDLRGYKGNNACLNYIVIRRYVF